MTSIAFILLFVSSSLLIKHANSAKILYISYIGCKSTFSMHQSITSILLANHHEITAISPLPLGRTHPNYTNLEAYDDFYQFSDQFYIEDGTVGIYTSRKLGYEFQMPSCEKIYQNTKVIETLKNINVDLILLEIDAGECYFRLLAHFPVPIIGINTQNILFPDFDGLLGNPANPSYVPGSISGFSTKMNFFQRLLNTKDYVLHLAIGWYHSNEMVTDVFGREHRGKLLDRISLVFVNGHHSFLPKPLAPSTVGIAGIHIGKPSPLPQEIHTFMEGSTKGIIYLSLGSVAKFSTLPKHIHDSFVNVFQKSKYRIIWRHDKPEMIGNISGNILVRKWLPQKDILAHPKLIMFISHCGIFSTYESIHFAVPVLALPVHYDQFTNAAIIENLGIGIIQDFRKIDEKSLALKIDEIVQNNTYRKNIKKLSNIFKDRPQSSQDTLLYWVDYILRHKNASYLKPAGAKLPFHQYLLLDIILFATVTLLGLSWVVYSILKMIASAFQKIFVKIQNVLINISTSIFCTNLNLNSY